MRRLPLQHLLATAVTDPASTPFVLLPFSQYLVLLIAALLTPPERVRPF